MTLEAIKTRTTRYKGRDGKWRAVLLWTHYEELLRMIEEHTKHEKSKS